MTKKWLVNGVSDVPPAPEEPHPNQMLLVVILEARDLVVGVVERFSYEVAHV